MKIANGAGGCSNANGCWSVNGGAAVAAEGDTAQDVALFQLPARGYVDDATIATATACAGATTVQITSLGTATDTDLFSGAITYDAKAAVADANFFDVHPTAGRKTKAAENFIAVVTTSVENVDQITAGVRGGCVGEVGGAAVGSKS